MCYLSEAVGKFVTLQLFMTSFYLYIVIMSWLFCDNIYNGRKLGFHFSSLHWEVWILFVWFDSLRLINNLSVIKGHVFLCWTSTKLGVMFLLMDTTQWRQWASNQRPLGIESSTLPLSHCVPRKCFDNGVLASASMLRHKDLYLLGLSVEDLLAIGMLGSNLKAN